MNARVLGTDEPSGWRSGSGGGPSSEYDQRTTPTNTSAHDEGGTSGASPCTLPTSFELEPHHSHFVIVDGEEGLCVDASTEKKFNAASKLRKRLEEKMHSEWQAHCCCRRRHSSHLLMCHVLDLMVDDAPLRVVEWLGRCLSWCCA